jgi:hypothetical protein
VLELHLFDGDRLFQHNGFRSPGASTREELEQTPFKADYFAARYSNIHKGIHSQPMFIDSSNVNELTSLDFVFVCVDNGEARKLICERLQASEISFIDVGRGIHAVDGKLRGIVRTTCSARTMQQHVPERIPFDERSC